jgi:methenyltetrahydromethanopterin cyclohydrolase
MDTLNERAWKLAHGSRPVGVRAVVSESGACILDCGVEHPGSLGAGVFLARLTLADLATVRVEHRGLEGLPLPCIVVETDEPVRACMASQYAGWQVKIGTYRAMGSGPFRALWGKEAIYDEIGFREQGSRAVGALETHRIPSAETSSGIATALGVPPSNLVLAVASTRSLSGAIQVVARSVETALHKLHALGFDLSTVLCAMGSAPLPPTSADDLTALGRTNDSVLYGAVVDLWVRGDFDRIVEVGPRVPSSASPDHGRPFGEIFAAYGHDFYRIDPHLFSPAEIRFVHVDSGRTARYGSPSISILRRSFFGEE